MTDRATLVERPVDVIARTFYEWGIGRGNDFGWDDAPTSIRDRCYHAADAAMRGIALLESSITPKDGLREALENLCESIEREEELNGSISGVLMSDMREARAALSSTAPIVDGDNA